MTVEVVARNPLQCAGSWVLPFLSAQLASIFLKALWAVPRQPSSGILLCSMSCEVFGSRQFAILDHVDNVQSGDPVKNF